MKKRIDHPYWKIYCKLVALQNCNEPDEIKDKVRLLAIDSELSTVHHLIINSKMLLPKFHIKMVQNIFYESLREKFAYSLLAPDILESISKYSPIVELGAGNGYYAWILEQMGAEVIAIDKNPVTEGKNWFYLNPFGFPRRIVHSWSNVRKGDSEILESAQYEDYTMLLCWPPRNAMALKALFYYPGHRIIFIGNKGNCATAAFYDKLEKEWRLETSIKTGGWDFIHTEYLEIYSR